MTRILAWACLLGMLFIPALFSQVWGGTAPAEGNRVDVHWLNEPGFQQPPTDPNNPPEEDESLKPKVYPFNPLESDRNIKVGNFYFRRKDYHGALSRYEDATKFNPTSAEAFFKVGEAEEKLKRNDLAKIAFQKVVQMAPDSKLAQEAKKKLGGKS